MIILFAKDIFLCFLKEIKAECKYRASPENAMTSLMNNLKLKGIPFAFLVELILTQIMKPKLPS